MIIPSLYYSWDEDSYGYGLPYNEVDNLLIDYSLFDIKLTKGNLPINDLGSFNKCFKKYINRRILNTKNNKERNYDKLGRI